MYVLDTLSCGGISGIPVILPNLVSLVVNLIKIVVPILLVIYGMLDLGKAVMAQKDDEIKKGQQTFVKRLIAAIIVFFIIVIVKLVIGLVAENGQGISDCIDQILSCKSMDC